MLEVAAALSVVLNVVVLVVVFQLTGKLAKVKATDWGPSFAALEKEQEKVQKCIREEMGQIRQEMGESAKQNREELSTNLHSFNQSMMMTFGEMANQLKSQLAAFTQDLNNSLHTNHQHMLSLMGEMAGQQKSSLDSFAKQLTDLTNMNEQKLENIRSTVEQKLTLLQEDNQKKLEQMRVTVDEKLHATLEKRLGDSFKMVSDRLELVHKGLGEMQNLAAGVGDLKRVLSNVKTRGTLGEIQLGNLLEQVLSFDQYESNAVTRKGSSERVEFVVKLPSKEENQTCVLLPIDSKFPLEDYQRLMDAQDLGDVPAANEAAKQLEIRIKAEAKSIREKYINPPMTTDFAILFLPIEGLFAEVLRRPGLWDTLQREYRVIITGPTTLAALLNSLQMGFRTLAIQKRSSEVWQLLGAVKSEFGKFGDILDKTQKKLQEASNTIESAAKRGRAIERKLKNVEELPNLESGQFIGELGELEVSGME